MKTTVHRGIIQGFHGSWRSGLGTLIISGRPVHCDNAPTVRALDACFGNVIGGDHDLRAKGGHVGKDVVYSMDEMGLVLEAFTPTKDWRAMYGRKYTPRVGESLEIETDELPVSNE